MDFHGASRGALVVACEGQITVADVLDVRTPVEHERMVDAWARDVWAAWEPRHATIRAWIERGLPEHRLDSST